MTVPRGSVDSVVAADVVLEARVDDLLDGVGPVQPDHVRDLLRTLADRDGDDGALLAPAGRPAGLVASDLALGLVGLLALELRTSSLAVRSWLRASSWVAPTRKGTSTMRQARGDGEVDGGPGVDVLVAVGVLVDDLVRSLPSSSGSKSGVVHAEPGVADGVARLVLGQADHVRDLHLLGRGLEQVAAEQDGARRRSTRGRAARAGSARWCAGRAAASSSSSTRPGAAPVAASRCWCRRSEARAGRAARGSARAPAPVGRRGSARCRCASRPRTGSGPRAAWRAPSSRSRRRPGSGRCRGRTAAARARGRAGRRPRPGCHRRTAAGR